MIRTAFVIPWFGPALLGEAERQIFQVATRLAERGHLIEVLTTCCRSSEDDWQQNHLPEGVSDESGIVVRRFPVRPRNVAAFETATRKLIGLNQRPKAIGVCPASEETARAFVHESIRSPKLLRHLERERERYQSIVFAPYSCGPTLLGVERTTERAYLQPLLHEETFAYLPAVEAIFHKARRILFKSEEEAMLAARLFGPSMWRKGVITGEATDPREEQDGACEDTDWEKVIVNYEEALELRPSGRTRPPPRRPTGRRIHQLLQGLDYGDAISNQAVFINEVLRDLGYQSEVFALDIGPPMRDLARRYKPGDISPADGLIFHHSIGTPLTSQAIQHPGPKVLVYHNITPGHFFEPWDPAFARLLDAGCKDLHQMAPRFALSVGDSSYNAGELRHVGFREPGVMPIFVDPMRWAHPADPEWMEMLQDGRTNLLFVGRVAPNKCQHHLVEAFKQYLSFDPKARLVLVGVWPDGDQYVRFLRDEADRLGVRAQVLLSGRVTDAQLLACYRTAHLFWSMSEHEGFGVPLIEAMWFDVPVLAYRSTAIPETLGTAGLMFTEKNRMAEVAALAHLLVEDRALRQRVIAAQRARRSGFLPEATLPILLELVSRLEAGETTRIERAEAVHDSLRQQLRFETGSEYARMTALGRRS